MILKRILLLNTNQTNNNRCYTIESLQSIADQINESPTHKKFGRNKYESAILTLSEASFTVSNAVIENNSLYIDIEVLSTPAGEELKNMINEVAFRPMTMIPSDEDYKIISSKLTYLYTAAIEKSTDALNL